VLQLLLQVHNSVSQGGVDCLKLQDTVAAQHASSTEVMSEHAERGGRGGGDGRRTAGQGVRMGRGGGLRSMRMCAWQMTVY
jgi:hypothetical protein